MANFKCFTYFFINIIDQFMDNIRGQSGKVPGPIAMSFPGIDQQTDKTTEEQTGTVLL